MMLRDIISKVLFEKKTEELTKDEIKVCNQFLHNYCKIRNLLEVK